MSYNLHITRAASYMEDPNPITLKEIENLLETLPEGFSINRSGIVTARTPQGQEISTDVGAFIIYEKKEDVHSRVYLYFDEETGPWFTVRNEMEIIPIIELADLIHAKVQGDEEEIYTVVTE